ncbi:MAG: hypothetical protein ACXWCM_00980 [Acidimicrobiales bacterium]
MGPYPTTPPSASPASPDSPDGAPIARRSRRLRRALGALGALALGAGALVLVAPDVSAGPVPYTVDFDHPAIPVGGVDEAYLDCEDDAGASIPVTVTDPNSVATTYHVDAAGASAGSPGRLFVEEGPDGRFSAEALGHWSVDVACPSYDVFTTGFDVLTPTLGLEISADRDYDCTTDETGPYLVGDRETMCFRVTNATGQDIRSLRIVTPLGQSFEYYGAGEVPSGTSIVTGASDGTVVPFDGATIDGLLVIAEIGQEGSGTFAVSALGSFSFNALPAPLEVQVTTGLTAGTACPDAGGLADRTVDPGTSVWFCYTARNTSAITFHDHTVTDDVLGLEFGGVHDLAPGETVSYVAANPVVATASTSHTLSWWAHEQNDYSPLGDDYAVTVEAVATVAVVGSPTVVTVPITTPVPPLPSAVAPDVVSTTAQFTG